MNIVVLVPFYSEDESRLRVWEFVRDYIQHTIRYPLFVGEDRSDDFNIGLARNRAADLAGDWDIAIIMDADTIVSKEQIEEGIMLCKETHALVFPFSERWELNDQGTRLFIDGSIKWQGFAERHIKQEFVSGCAVVSRDTWDSVRGYDPGFVGWGHEDGAFATAISILTGRDPLRTDGKSLHLSHTPSLHKNMNSVVYKTNADRYRKYYMASLRSNAKELMVKLRDETIDIV